MINFCDLFCTNWWDQKGKLCMPKVDGGDSHSLYRILKISDIYYIFSKVISFRKRVSIVKKKNPFILS